MSPAIVSVSWNVAAPAIGAAFLASLVEVVEAFTIVLAVGLLRAYVAHLTTLPTQAEVIGPLNRWNSAHPDQAFAFEPSKGTLAPPLRPVQSEAASETGDTVTALESKPTRDTRSSNSRTSPGATSTGRGPTMNSPESIAPVAPM